MNPIDFLSKLISFESLSTQEKDIADWLENQLRNLPSISVHRVENNLIAWLGNSDQSILFNTHLDVVPASPHHLYSAFKPFVSDGKLFGRGSTDAKGALTAMFFALKKYIENGHQPKRKIVVAFTACEEAYGDYNGVQLLKSKGLFNDVISAVVGEPTSLQPCIAQKGILLLDLIMRGKSGHAARIENKDNLLFALPDVINALKNIDFEMVNPWLGKTKLTPTRILGGTANNMAPEEIRITVDVRTIPEVTSSVIVEHLQQTLPMVEILVKSDRFKAVSTDEDSEIAQIAFEITEKPFFGSPTCSDWAFLGDIPTIKLGPGHSEQSHTADESIEIEQLEKGIEVYFRIMEKW
jgi:acetylornithine deacetylase